MRLRAMAKINLGLDIRGNDPEAILREAQERAARLAAEI